MRNSGAVIGGLVLILSFGVIRTSAENYDDAPDFILHATLSEMTNPPSYNLYAQFKKTKVGPIDIWYRLKFDDSGRFIDAMPVYATRDDSALIRSSSNPDIWRMFRPGPDTSYQDQGYLVRLGIRDWIGQCQYETVPHENSEEAARVRDLPELLWSDSIFLPRMFFQSDFSAQTRVRYFVNEFGDVCAAQVLETSGCALFDLFALDVAESWHHRPAFSDRKPIGMWINWVVSTENAPEDDTVDGDH